MTTYGVKVTRPIVGRPFPTSDGSLYAYSGMIDFDGTAALSYEMMRFTLQKDIIFKMQFNADWRLAVASGTSLGYLINIAGVDVIKGTYTYVDENPAVPYPINFYIPANAETIISVLNPDTNSTLVHANITLLGNYLKETSRAEDVGTTTTPPLLAQLERNTQTARKPDLNLIGAIWEGGW